MSEEFLTVAEVAETLKVDPQTVRNWIGRGELKAVRVGARRVRIRRSDLEAMLEVNTSTRPDPRDVASWSRFGAALAEAADDARRAGDLETVVQALDRLTGQLGELRTSLTRNEEQAPKGYGIERRP